MIDKDDPPQTHAPPGGISTDCFTLSEGYYAVLRFVNFCHECNSNRVYFSGKLQVEAAI